MVDNNGDGVVSRRDYRTTKNSSLSDGAYNFMKDFTTIYGPAAITLYAGLAVLFAWPDPEKWVAAAGLVLVFLGAVLKVNSNRYAKESSDGILILDESDPDVEATVGLSLTVPYEQIKGKDEVKLLVKRPE